MFNILKWNAFLKKTAGVLVSSNVIEQKNIFKAWSFAKEKCWIISTQWQIVLSHFKYKVLRFNIYLMTH